MSSILQGQKPEFSEFTLFSHSSLTYMESISTRWTDMVTMAAGSFSMIYSMFLMFLLGVYFVKMEFFKDMEAKSLYGSVSGSLAQSLF